MEDVRAARFKTGGFVLGLINYAHDRVEGLLVGRGWDIEYPQDVWRLRNLGISGDDARIRFDRILQPWLRDLAKQWVRWRLSTGLGTGQASRCAAILSAFGQFLAGQPDVDRLADIGRNVLERYLAWVASLDQSHRPVSGRASRYCRSLAAAQYVLRAGRPGTHDLLPSRSRFTVVSQREIVARCENMLARQPSKKDKAVHRAHLLALGGLVLLNTAVAVFWRWAKAMSRGYQGPQLAEDLQRGQAC